MADGEQTIFNMINGFCGNMLLSGHFDYADEYNNCLLYTSIASILSEIQPLTAAEMRLAEKMKIRYLCSMGDCVRCMVPVSYTHLDVYKRQD